MGKHFTKAAILIDGLLDDVFWLLILIYARRVCGAFPQLTTMSRERFVMELILLESTDRDVVSRLTALDDDGKNIRSFQTAFSAMNREGLDPKRTKALGALVKQFRQSLTHLKTSHRNEYIAHVSELASVAPRVMDDPVPFEVAASNAVNLLDALAGQKMQYHFESGSVEGTVNLRQALAL